MNKRYNSIIHGYTKSAPKRVKAKQAKQLARQARQTSLPLGGRSVGRFVSLDLMQDLGANKVVYRTHLPWGDWLEHRARKLTPGRRREILANSADTDLVVYGRVFNAMPTVSGAAKIEAELWLLKRKSAQVLWYGFKRIEWKKKVRMDDAMAHAASLYVREWPLGRI